MARLRCPASSKATVISPAVERVDPIANYYAAVTRRTSDGAVFYGDQQMSRLEALRSYTVANAFAAFEEDLKGTLTVGKLADVTVLNRDLTAVPDAAIRETAVVYTIIGDKIVYRGNCAEALPGASWPRSCLVAAAESRSIAFPARSGRSRPVRSRDVGVSHDTSCARSIRRPGPRQAASTLKGEARDYFLPYACSGADCRAGGCMQLRQR